MCIKSHETRSVISVAGRGGGSDHDNMILVREHGGCWLYNCLLGEEDEHSVSVLLWGVGRGCGQGLVLL